MKRIFVPLLLLLACNKDDVQNGEGPALPVDYGEGLFSEGCPTSEKALAREIGVSDTLPGKVAVGTEGDFLLANTHAAFVITDPVGQSTYWYYGGALADAAPMDGCNAGEDKLDDLGFVLVEIDLLAVEQSEVRAFRAESVTVLNDGSDGQAAIIRAVGTDDFHWLVEYTLIRDATDQGGRPLSDPFGAEITVDYILEPNSSVLQIEMTVENVGDDSFNLIEAALISYGHTLSTYTYASQTVDLAGFRFEAGLPWSLATDGDSAYAWGIEDATLATMSIAGINIAVDLTQLTNGFDLSPGQNRTLTRFFSVGASGGPSATAPLLEATQMPLLDQPATVGEVSGQIVDHAGQAVQASVVVEAQAPDADWAVLDVVSSASDGTFALVIPDFEQPWQFRVFVRAEGRDDSASATVVPGDTGVSLVAEPHGALSYAITDGSGAASPGRLYLKRDDGARLDYWLADTGEVGVPPGHWDWTVTRGYEYQPARGSFDIADDGTVAIDPVLAHVVDTTGWMSADSHVHSADSPDSDIEEGDQLLHAAAHGLDIVIHTEHENIVDRSTVPSDRGLDAWVNNVIGEEVTSVAIEHMTMFPAVPDGSLRGGPVEWYHHDIERLFGAMRERSGGGVNLMNHPSYLDQILWDQETASPLLNDPTLLGLQADAALWSWNLDGIELMNGHGNIWADGNRRFDNWMSMVNAGHQLVGVGCSDDHHGGGTGFPRSYFPSSSDAPADLNTAELVDGYKSGALITSAGGFARVDIGGSGPGELVSDDDGWVDLTVHLEALGEVDMTHFVVFANCDQVDSVLVTDPYGVEKFSGVVPLNIVGDTHVVIAAFGADNLADGLPQYDATKVPRVLSNPIYVDADGDGLFSAPGGRLCSYDLDVSLAL